MLRHITSTLTACALAGWCACSRKSQRLRNQRSNKPPR